MEIPDEIQARLEHEKQELLSRYFSEPVHLSADIFTSGRATICLLCGCMIPMFSQGGLLSQTITPPGAAKDFTEVHRTRCVP